MGTSFAGDVVPVADCPGGVCLAARSSARPGGITDVAAPSGSARVVACSYKPLPPDEVADLETVSSHPRQHGGWFYRPCQGGDGRTMRQWQGPVWLAFPTASPAPGIDPAALAQEAYRLLPIPTPKVGTNPPANQPQLVNLATWLWIDQSTWGTRTATVSVPGESVTATATPRHVVWSMGDGHTVSCEGAGTPYAAGRSSTRQPTCVHTYERSSVGEPGNAFPVRATVTWTVTWNATGAAPASGQLPPLDRTTELDLTVGEAQALN